MGGIRYIEVLRADSNGTSLRAVLEATGEQVDVVMVEANDHTWRLNQLLVGGGDTGVYPLSGTVLQAFLFNERVVTEVGTKALLPLYDNFEFVATLSSELLTVRILEIAAEAGGL